ncbi:MAG: alkaline phosphatase [Cytophagaceae bacterium]|jgi:alkaline phosphatase|nr:alkaline phosphatase [Cytophagaceae bacterium]
MNTRFINKSIVTILLLLSAWGISVAQIYQYQPYRKKVRATKNLIVMIPDGTSIGVVTAARWYKALNNMGDFLHIDPYLCGTVKTYCSDAPIGDSAPTTSCYMTGMPQQAGNVSIYPQAHGESDLVEVDSTMIYQPLATLLEAARIEQGKATGLVVTCEFSHATPADCSAHHYNRNDYNAIGSQMVYQNLDVMFGGGNNWISDDMIAHLKSKNIKYIKDDAAAFRILSNEKAWALFGEMELPFDLDRDIVQVPSLEDMTRKALDILSQNERGFFMMVEGSKVDWAAHANDAVACITEFIAFDNAVGAAIEFAQKDGNTTVVILPDHGNSGFTTGNYNLQGYAKASLEQLFENVSKFRKTSEGMEQLLINEKPENLRHIIKEYTSIEITDEEYDKLLNSKNYHVEDYTKVGDNPNMQATLAQIMNARTYFGFTTGGHTGEEVFLAAYHPQSDIPLGMNTNIEINRYFSDVMGLETKLPELTNRIFAKHQNVFNGYSMIIDKSDNKTVLIVKNKKKTLEIPAFKSIATLNGKPFDIGSVVIYIDKNDTFYLPKALREVIK